MIRSGWVVAFEDGSRMSATEEGGTLEVHAWGLTHRVDRSSRLYPWHRVHEIEWKSSETGRSSVAQAANLRAEEDPFNQD